jgi:hypothetical protein
LSNRYLKTKTQFTRCSNHAALQPQLKTKTMKKPFKILGYLLLTLAFTLGVIFLVAWRSPKYYTPQQAVTAPYLPFAQYTGDHDRPFVITKGNVVIFGAEHTKDPRDPQLARLEKSWKNLQPTVALVEGRLGFLLPGLMDPVASLGEGGKVKALALRSDIPLYNWDLSKEALAERLQKHFSREQIALAQILNPYFSQLRFGKPSDPAAYLEPYFKRAAFVGLQDSIRTVEDIDRIWKGYFPRIDWRDVSDEQALPGYLADLMAMGNDLRNQQLISVVKELTGKGERVFLVCGSSHAYCVQPAFQ